MINTAALPQTANTPLFVRPPSTMMFLPALVGFLLMLTADARVGNSSDVQFCSETDQCLMFDLICETDEYEVRHYESVKWVSTDESSVFMEMAAMRAFRRLFNYIRGANSKGGKVEMTSPVQMRMVEKKFWQKGKYTMSFLLPAEHQKDPPKPNDPDVYIHETPDVNMYVRTYGGWMSAWTDKKEAKALCGALDSVKAKYQKDFHIAAGYNSPMTMFDRHNEVWVIAQGDPVCPGNEDV